MGSKFIYYADKSTQQSCQYHGCVANNSTHSRLYAFRKDVLSLEALKFVDGRDLIPRLAVPLSDSSALEFWHDFDHRRDNNLIFEPAFEAPKPKQNKSGMAIVKKNVFSLD